MPSVDGERGGLRHRRITRTLLSLLFLLHLGALAVWFVPEPGSLDPLPDAVQRPLEAVLPPLAEAAWPVARRYLDLTATRQRWTLFAPDPADWAVSLEAVVYWPLATEPGRGAEAGRWRADTLTIDSARERPYPHFTDHRADRIVFNLGYEGWGDFYRPWFARHLCRTLAERDGRAPDGIALTARWVAIPVPGSRGAADAPPRTHEQFLIGHTCEGGAWAGGFAARGRRAGASPLAGTGEP